MSYVKIGVAGPVGSGKTALIECLTRLMSKEYSIGVITNDIYTCLLYTSDAADDSTNV